MTEHPQKITVVVNSLISETSGASSLVYYHIIKNFINHKIYVTVIIFSKNKDCSIAIKENFNSEYLTVIWSKENASISLNPLSKYFIFKQPQLNIEETKVILDSDCVFCLDFISARMVCRHHHKNKSIWLGDMLFELEWFSYLEELKDSPLKIYKIPVIMYKTIILLLGYKFYLTNFKKIICCSKTAEKRLKLIGINARFKPFPYADGLHKTKYTHKGGINFLFFGNLQGLGSRSGLNALLNKIIPRMRKSKKLSGSKIIICGRVPPSLSMEMTFSRFPEIQYRGFVTDIGEVFKEICAILVPISVPVGNRTRVLSAFSCGMPVIAHKNVSRGNNVMVNCSNAMLCESADEYINAMELLLTDNELWKNISNNSKDTYNLYYSLNSHFDVNEYI
jgi:glycosyltransferase involved in cell wall biosynthesis